MFRRTVIGLFVAALTLSACNNGSPIRRLTLKGRPSSPVMQEPSVLDIEAAVGDANSLVRRQAAGISRAVDLALPAAANATGVPANLKLIRNANARVEVPSVDAAVDSLESLVRSVGGYIGSQAEHKDQFGATFSTVACRIPADRLDSVLPMVRGLGKVEMMSISSQDITEQYFDLEIRLANKKALEQTLLKLLGHKTEDLSDLLQVENELARVRGEIEQMEGRRRFWDNQIALSTLAVELHEPGPVIAAEAGGPLRRLGESFGQAGENFVATLAWLVASLGVIVPVGVAGFVFVRLSRPVWRRFRRVRKTAAAA